MKPLILLRQFRRVGEKTLHGDQCCDAVAFSGRDESVNDCYCQRGACGATADGEAFGIRVELLRIAPSLSTLVVSRIRLRKGEVSTNPFIRSKAVLDRRRKVHKGEDAVLDRDDHTRHLRTKRAAHVVFGVQIATEPASAVAEDDAR